MGNRLRPTFLLRVVVLSIAVAAFAAAWWLFDSIGWTLVTLGVAAVLWFVGIELELVPSLMARLAVSQARRRGLGDSLWFVDVEAEQRRSREQSSDDTSDNPTIR